MRLAPLPFACSPAARLFEAGCRFGAAFLKRADDDAPQVAYNLVGMLQVLSNGYLVVSVPNALARGIFAAIREPGVELPPGPDGGRFNAHVVVMTPDELALAGGADRITERGKPYAYTLGRWYVHAPADWPTIARAWYVRVHSPELQTLRRSYGLSPLPHGGDHEFHAVVAVLRRGVLGRNDTGKGAD